MYAGVVNKAELNFHLGKHAGLLEPLSREKVIKVVAPAMKGLQHCLPHRLR